MHPAYKHIEPAKNYPNSSKVLDNVFFVGCSPTINDDMIVYIETVVEEFKTKTLFYVSV
jgi:dTDP-4-amino-4,6-dideoxygalactose transaminase